MIDYNKTEIRDALTLENVFDLLQEWGGDPEYTSFGILSATICHNKPGEGSRKLYFYDNSRLFKCYTGCDAYFDIFELVCKVASIQQGLNFDLNDAVRWIAKRFGIMGSLQEDDELKSLEDWSKLAAYDRIEELQIKDVQDIILKEYDTAILDNLNYTLQLTPWLKENISQDALDQAHIGYYPGGNQISIPHFDVNGRFIGLRGRALCKDEAEMFGKYRPIRANRQWYNHPLGMNLYNLNFAKDAIKVMKKAIVFEGKR